MRTNFIYIFVHIIYAINVQYVVFWGYLAVCVVLSISRACLLFKNSLKYCI